MFAVVALLAGAWTASAQDPWGATPAPPAAPAAPPATTEGPREYCLLIGTVNVLTGKVIVSADYGQTGRYADKRLRDEETGKVEKFLSMVDAINQFEQEGWRFENAYAMCSSSGCAYHYLMKRPK